MLQGKGIDYRVLIDLHDMTPPNQGWRDTIRQEGEEDISRGWWARNYVDEHNEVIFTGYPHFQISVYEYDKPLQESIRKYLLERQSNIPPLQLRRQDIRTYSTRYIEWYRGWSHKGLQLLPAGIRISDLPRAFNIGKNHVVVEFVPKVDYLTDNMKNGNVHKITTENGYNFIESMIDYFLKNPYESLQTIS